VREEGIEKIFDWWRGWRYRSRRRWWRRRRFWRGRFEGPAKKTLNFRWGKEAKTMIKDERKRKTKRFWRWRFEGPAKKTLTLRGKKGKCSSWWQFSQPRILQEITDFSIFGVLILISAFLQATCR
jgi:hypothetical protein